jgi:ABC-type antimicrobial peptide transport system permease subunit
MFFTCLRRELRRRHRAALVVALGLALGIGLVITVNAVSSGMGQAQDSVLKSLYGLGTDMTVTKAQTASGAGSATPPKFDFDADSSGTTQSSDRVMVQGFQTLGSSVVASIGRQHGVAKAVGGLNLQVLQINGSFKQGQFHQSPSSGGNGSGSRGFAPGSGSGSGSTPPQGEVRGGGAQFDANNYSVAGVDTADLGLGPMATSKITSGRTFTAADADAKKAVADSAYAKRKSLKVGSTVTVKGVKYSVIGIATADSGDAAADLYLPLKQAQTLASAAGKVTTVYVKASSSQQIGAVKSAIQQNVSGTTVTTSADLASTVSGSLSTASSLATDVGRWLSIAVLAAAFLVAGLLTSSAVSRRVREFGTLKALGWKSGRVTRQVMGEALVNGLIGGVLGIALGLAGAYAVSAASPTLSAQLGSSGGGTGGPGAAGSGGPGGAGGPGFGGARQAAAKTLDVALTAPVHAGTIALAVALAVGGGLVAGGFGGWRASRLRPADALRRVA